MTQEQFIYWLQGKLEGREAKNITKQEVQEIINHLQTVFHKVTPLLPYDPITPIEYNPYKIIC